MNRSGRLSPVIRRENRHFSKRLILSVGICGVAGTCGVAAPDRLVYVTHSFIISSQMQAHPDLPAWMPCANSYSNFNCWLFQWDDREMCWGDTDSSFKCCWQPPPNEQNVVKRLKAILINRYWGNLLKLCRRQSDRCWVLFFFRERWTVLEILMC